MGGVAASDPSSPRAPAAARACVQVSVERKVLSSKASHISISIAGRIDDRNYHMCRVLGRALVEENTHVSLELVPMMETQWEDFIRATSAVC
jgi:hypothetical protein